ncbi:DNA oxidative demethylase AlkB [Pandoraea sputorum]|uniref:Alpha-ketoglutarate-dependent dioxygenase AlkB n=1 Tax=Pandoraea sputorum TaxID=93222 RepID=A0A239S8K2_9BURK|nr:DNA oxidative demethylase AlkB [Pandoraea sputorum]AJC15733.1 alpha-ketoglutarate-dependent dioxygenase AlkB [Pandoraea sputorum]SNU81248.1 Alpha-ketoglutarate-dependent dioxygenase AlkB [Pandoraea sputorum]VVD68820.1 alpha-ketoglutarate-dependent dioxygenase AlkB [Pandoraea sputorum]
MTFDLFGNDADDDTTNARHADELGPGAFVLRGFARSRLATLQTDIDAVIAQAPLRHWLTPGGKRMSVAMTNCGDVGWISDKMGYRYGTHDPLSKQPWPAMPASFVSLASDASEAAGYRNFSPDACLINRYTLDARLTLHQDRDERELGAPIVSVSLGLPAVFLWGGLQRGDRTRRVRLEPGDVVVWGGPSRLVYHGIASVEGSFDAQAVRYNLTFRQAR